MSRRNRVEEILIITSNQCLFIISNLYLSLLLILEGKWLKRARIELSNFFLYSEGNDAKYKSRPVQTIKDSIFNFYYYRNGLLLLNQNYTRYREIKYLIGLQ